MGRQRLFGFLLCVLITLAAAHAASAQDKAHHFSSDLGYEFTYPQQWTSNLLGSFPLMTAADLDAHVRQNPQWREQTCTQKIFFAKLGTPASNLIAGVVPSACAGTLPSLEAFTARTKANIAGDYQLASFEEGRYQVGTQSVWVLRAKGESRRIPSGVVTVEYVATLLRRGIAYWSVEARSPKAKSDFEQIAVKFAGGPETALVPSSMQLAALPLSRPAPTQAKQTEDPLYDLLKPDAHASHHFESGVGFSYDVPDDMTILNATRMTNFVHGMAQRASKSDAEARSTACAQVLLAAQNPQDPSLVSITAHAQDCIGYAIRQEILPQVGQHSIEQLKKSYELSFVQTTPTVLGEHPVWAMRAAISPKDPLNPMHFMAMLLVPVPGGMTEILVQSRTRAGLETLMKSKITFEDGAESELIPVSAFRGKKQP